MYRYATIIFAFALPAIASAACVDFSHTLKYQDQDNDVLLMQKVLNGDTRTRVTADGAGSPGNEINFFGRATYRAVKKFQTLYRDEVLTPANLTYSTGVAGELTRKKLAALSCGVDTQATVATSTTAGAATVPETVHRILFSASPYRSPVNFHNTPTATTSGAVSNSDPSLKNPTFTNDNALVASPGETMKLRATNMLTSNYVNICGSQTSVALSSDSISGIADFSITIPSDKAIGSCSILIRNSNGQSAPLGIIIKSPDASTGSTGGLPSNTGGQSNTDPKFYCESLAGTISATAGQNTGTGVSITSTTPWNIKDGMTVQVSGTGLNLPGTIEVQAGRGTFSFPSTARPYPYATPNASTLYFTLDPNSFTGNGESNAYLGMLKTSSSYDEAMVFTVANSNGTSNVSGLCRINPDRAGAAQADAGPFASPGTENITRAQGTITQDANGDPLLELSDGRTIPLNVPTGMNTFEGDGNIVQVSGTISDVIALSAQGGLTTISPSNMQVVSRSIPAYITGATGDSLSVIEQGTGYGFRVYGQIANIQPGTFETFDASIKKLDVSAIRYIRNTGYNRY